MKKRGLIIILTLAFVCAGNFSTVSVQAAADTKTESADDLGETTLAVSGITKDGKGGMYLADRVHNVLRKRTKNGTVTVLAGKADTPGYKNGSAASARFHAPWDVVAYQGGWLISDSENHALRLYKNGKVTTVAGTGAAGYKDGTGKKARFNRPTGMAEGKNGEVYIADTGNHVIRRIDKNGKVTTYAGGASGCADGTLKKARFLEPTGLYYDQGALYVADSGNHRICKIKNGKVTTVAGSAKGMEGLQDGSASKARLSNPQDIFVTKNTVYISDTGNGCVRKLYKGKVTTLIHAFSMSDGCAPAEPCGLTVQNGRLFVGDTFAEELLELEL